MDIEAANAGNKTFLPIVIRDGRRIFASLKVTAYFFTHAYIDTCTVHTRIDRHIESATFFILSSKLFNIATLAYDYIVYIMYITFEFFCALPLTTVSILDICALAGERERECVCVIYP